MCLSLLSRDVIKTMSKCTLVRKAFLTFSILWSIIEEVKAGAQDRNPERGTAMETRQKDAYL